MRRSGHIAWLTAFLIVSPSTLLPAGTLTPYELVLLDVKFPSEFIPGVVVESTILSVDVDTGDITGEIPIEGDDVGVWSTTRTIAVDSSSGAVYAYYDLFVGPDDLFRGSLIARLDPTTSQWAMMRIEGEIDYAEDMEFKPDGNLIVVSEFSAFSRLDEIDLEARRVEPSGARFPPGSYGDEGPLSVEVHSSGTIVSSGVLGAGGTTVLFRQTPEADIAERFDPGVRLIDFSIDSDGSLIGVEASTSRLYRLDFDTKAVDVLDGEPFDSELLQRISKIKLDPNGRIVALSHTSEWEPRLVRLDLELGTVEPIADLEGRSIWDMDVLLPPEGSLWAGDADQDLDFDQLDLVQLQVAAKYLTGQFASWGQGDWDGAPGGRQDNPPSGNGLFDQLDLIAALIGGHYLTGQYAAVQRDGVAGDGQTSIVYDMVTGEIAVDIPAATELTSINIDSAASIFNGDAAENLGGSFDNDADDNIFKATFGSSFGSLSFGNVAQPGLTEEFLLTDLTVIGSLNGGGDLGDVDLIYVPEPSGVVILCVGALALVTFRRRAANVRLP